MSSHCKRTTREQRTWLHHCTARCSEAYLGFTQSKLDVGVGFTDVTSWRIQHERDVDWSIFLSSTSLSLSNYALANQAVIHPVLPRYPCPISLNKPHPHLPLSTNISAPTIGLGDDWMMGVLWWGGHLSGGVAVCDCVSYSVAQCTWSGWWE